MLNKEPVSFTSSCSKAELERSDSSKVLPPCRKKFCWGLLIARGEGRAMLLLPACPAVPYPLSTVQPASWILDKRMQVAEGAAVASLGPTLDGCQVEQ